VTDAVGENDEIFFGIQQLSLAEQYAGESFVDQAAAGTSGTVHDQHRVGDAPLCIFFRLAEKRVVHAQFGQGFSRCKVEITDDVVALERPCRRRGGVAGRGKPGAEQQRQGRRMEFPCVHP